MKKQSNEAQSPQTGAAVISAASAMLAQGVDSGQCGLPGQLSA